jgi:CheY-like chemotaxis protein
VAKVIVANDGEEGYTQYKNNHVDIIITDYQMPRLDGLGLIQKIREENPTIPIILSTAIDATNIIIEALKLHVSNFVRKPIDTEELFEAVTKAAKMVLAERYIEAEQRKKMQDFQEKAHYSAYQERLAFDKELAILRNDFYYQILECRSSNTDMYAIIPDFIYRPLDILSGDAYSARKISDGQTFYLLVDGMGKGVSASLSAMLMTAHINYAIDNMLKHGDFDLHSLVRDAIMYIQPLLLEDEMISLDFIVMNQYENTMDYAKFAMPPSLLQDNTKKIIKLKSNNPPLNRYQSEFKITQIDISLIVKFLFCTDGLVENTLSNKQGNYESMIEKDFADAFTKEELRKLFLEKIDEQEDDVTLIFINRIGFGNSILHHRQFSTSLSALEEAGSWYESLWKSIGDDQLIIDNAQVVFTELMMNAYEHGNLGLGALEKHQLLEEDHYIDTLLSYEVESSKQIDVKVHVLHHGANSYIVTQITDEGKGFDTKTLSQIFRNTTRFNGKGVYISRQSSLGIYYNGIGNSVLFLHKMG